MDDDGLFAHSVYRMLVRLGHEVTVVLSGAGAIEAFNAASFDLVLLDDCMPGETGPETLEKLRTLDAGMRAVCMTGGSSAGVVDPAETV